MSKTNKIAIWILGITVFLVCLAGGWIAALRYTEKEMHANTQNVADRLEIKTRQSGAPGRFAVEEWHLVFDQWAKYFRDPVRYRNELRSMLDLNTQVLAKAKAMHGEQFAAQVKERLEYWQNHDTEQTAEERARWWVLYERWGWLSRPLRGTPLEHVFAGGAYVWRLFED